MVLTGVGLSLDFDIGLNYLIATSYGRLLSRLGWAAYFKDTFELPPNNWQGLEFGMKWVGMD